MVIQSSTRLWQPRSMPKGPTRHTPPPESPPLTEMETDDSRRWSRRSRVQNQQLISPLKM